MQLLLKIKGVFFLNKLYKRLYYNFIVMDKPTVKVIKVKEELDPLYNIKGFLIINSFYFFNISFILFYNNNKFKVLYIFYLKFIFFNINL